MNNVDWYVFSTLTSAPTTPRLVNLRYSNGLVLLVVWRNGYRNRGMCAKDQDQLIKLDQSKQLLEINFIIYQGYKTNHSCLHVSHQMLRVV